MTEEECERLVVEHFGQYLQRIEWEDRGHDLRILLSDDDGVTVISLPSSKHGIRVTLGAFPPARVVLECEDARQGRWSIE